MTAREPRAERKYDERGDADSLPDARGIGSTLGLGTAPPAGPDYLQVVRVAGGAVCERVQIPKCVSHLEQIAARRALGGSRERLGAADIASHRAHSNCLVRVRSPLRELRARRPKRTVDRGDVPQE